MDFIQFGGRAIGTLVALTKLEQAEGLMYQKWPPPIMSFPYDEPKIRKFWMKNTISPLDIVFCYKNKVSSIVAGQPLSEKHVGPEELTDLVVEMPRGLANHLGICCGQEVRLIYSIVTLAKKYELFISKNS